MTVVRKETMATPTGHENEILAYLGGIFVSIGIALGLVKMRVNTIDRIKKQGLESAAEIAKSYARSEVAIATAHEAKEECAELEQAMITCQSDIQTRHATNNFVQEVELRITKRMETIERNVLDAIKDAIKASK